MADLLTVEAAQRLIIERAHCLERESVQLDEAAGRVLALPARAVVDLPPFASSAMDGYAVQAADTPGSLRVVAHVAAGLPTDRSVGRGEAVGISTGGVVPAGADAIIPIESVVEHDNEGIEASGVAVGANIRERGGDLRAGDIVVGRGLIIGPVQLGALAAAGVAELACARRPRAAVVATGTELRRPGESLEPGQVYEANSTILSAQLASAGARVDRLPAVGDDEEDHKRALSQGLAGDVLVTSGGVSVGPHDLVRRIEAELGVEEVFWRVAVKPGKPVSFGVRGRTLVFGLPGNPVSALVAFELFVRPALLALQGAADPGPRYLPGRLARARDRNPTRDELVRARAAVVNGAVSLAPLSGQESHMIGRAASADALVLIPRGEGSIAAGEMVGYLPLG